MFGKKLKYINVKNVKLFKIILGLMKLHAEKYILISMASIIEVGQI